MINLPSNFKIVWIVAMIVLSAICAGNLHAQELEINLKVDSIHVNHIKEYSITVDVTKGKGPFVYYLYQGEPWRKGELLKKVENEYNSQYTFRNILPKNRYFIIVQLQNNEDTIALKDVKI